MFWYLFSMERDPCDNDYHLYITTCVEAIKPRQIINYDAGIVLIDLHQLNVKTTSDKYKSKDTEYVNHVNEEQNPQNNNPQHPLS